MASTQEETRLHQLLSAALAGDERAYAEFLSAVCPLVRSVARRKLASNLQVDAEDIVQETLLAIHLKRHTWRPDEPVTPWLFAIARYKIVDAYRRRGTRVEVDIADFVETLAGPETETLSGAEVSRALSCLSDGQRVVVQSISVDGLSIPETATRLGMKETAVRVALHRGLAAIAAKFGQQ